MAATGRSVWARRRLASGATRASIRVFAVRPVATCSPRYERGEQVPEEIDGDGAVGLPQGPRVFGGQSFDVPAQPGSLVGRQVPDGRGRRG